MPYTTQVEDFLRSVGGKMLSPSVVHSLYGSTADPADHWDFGWLSFGRRTNLQMALHTNRIAQLPAFKITGSWKQDKARYCLWKAYETASLGKFLPYNHQLTGSCVGAGGGNMAKTLMAGGAARGTMVYKELFWLYTYGKSRERDGSHSPGEGSTGSSYAQAATRDGYVAFDEDTQVLGAPAFDSGGWLTSTNQTEMKWSDGSAAPQAEVKLGLTHLIKAVAAIKSADDAVAALTNGYPLTLASDFGFNPMVPKPQGNPPVRLVTWNGSWSHQMYADEVWDHPTLGMIIRGGNNWGADAHGTPTGDEPPGGWYCTVKTFDDICRRGEVFAFSGDIAGFPAQSVDW